MQFRHRIASAVAAFSVSLASTAAIADQMFMKFEGGCGGEILGDSTDPQHPNEVIISSYSVGVDADSSWTKGGGASVGKPNPGEFKFNMASNRALPRILNCITMGKSLVKVTLSVRTDDPPGPKLGFEYLKYTLEGTFFTAVDQASATERGLVSVSMVYKTFKVQEFVQGAPNQTQCLLWDIPAGTAGTC